MPETQTAPVVRDDDIYTLLGVQPDVNGALAREMYWNRMQPLLEPERRDAEETRERIEALNEALTIILDAELRAAYDAERRRDGRAGPAETRPRGATPRRFLAAALLLLGIVATGAAFWVAVLAGASQSWPLALVAAPAALLFTAAWAVARRRAAAPLELLGLLPGAEPGQIDVAYRARAQDLLIRLASDERAIHALDRLDRAYAAAMGAAMARAMPAAAGWRAGAARGRPGGLAVGAGRLTVAVVRALWRLLTAGRRLLRPLLATAARAAGRGGRAMARRTRGAALEARAMRAPAAAPTIDLERRLAASFKASTLQIAAAAEPPVDPIAASAPPNAWLLLDAAVGTRRVPITTRPIRIGSARECDLVLPERSGVAAEHLMVWQRGEAVILHVTDPQAECTVNGEAVSWARLDDGDQLGVGTIQFRIESEPPA